VSNDRGLVNLLAEPGPIFEYQISTAAQSTFTTGLHVLPRGSGPARPGLLYSGRLAEIMAHLRKEFDYVLVDAPPALYVADTRVLGKCSDGAIFVVRSGRTTHDLVGTAIRRLTDDGITVLGTILNGCEPKGLERYGYGYGYGYGTRPS
jgi:receptor protein-tyrosine kinase